MIDLRARRAAVCLAVLAVAACSSEVGGRATAAPPVAAPPSSAVPTSASPTVPATTPPAVDPGLAAAADGLRPFLLTPAEVGPGFTAGQEPQPDPATPAVCGGPGVVAQFPYAVRVGASFDGPRAGVLLQETVSVYGDVGTAEVAYQATLDGLACDEGTLSDEPVVLTPAEDLTIDVPADRSTGWQIGGQGFDMILISSRSGELVVNFAFISPEGDPGDLPDPLAVARAGVEKLIT